MSAGVDLKEVGLETRPGHWVRENIATKSRRYLIEGRLIVKHVSPERIEAACRGTEQVHAVGYSHGYWSCTCPAKGRCSHVAALQLVTLPRGGTHDEG